MCGGTIDLFCEMHTAGCTIADGVCSHTDSATCMWLEPINNAPRPWAAEYRCEESKAQTILLFDKIPYTNQWQRAVTERCGELATCMYAVQILP